MKYYPATNRTCFEYQPSQDSTTYDHSFIFHSRLPMDGQFQRGLVIETPFTTVELLNAHVFCART